MRNFMHGPRSIQGFEVRVTPGQRVKGDRVANSSVVFSIQCATPYLRVGKD
jgi:hypothetical protein